MCGIYGWLPSSPAPERLAAVLERMGRTLAHRGPDGVGAMTDGRVGLGVRRLAIVDVAGGAQPVGNEDRTVIAACNGEIYNHAPVRADLAGRGHHFRSYADTAILPHLYAERGPGFMQALDGMFAFAVWDARRGRLVLARDRMGEKPLYYATTPDGVVFASEPKAILATDLVAPAPDWAAVSVYLRTGYVPAPWSALRGIAQLPPGGRLVAEGEAMHIDRYWELAPALAAPPLALDFQHAARLVRDELHRATQAALMSDVPVGVFLSGGMDSTAVTSLARGHLGSELATFALRFDTSGFDESEWALGAARALDTRHRTLTVTPELFLDGVRSLAPLLDEPLADPALVPTYLLARFAREHVKVVLTGEGADELFAGYPTYLGGRLATAWKRVPSGVRSWIAARAAALGAPAGNTTRRYLLRRFLEEAEAPPGARHRAWTGCFTAAALARLATPGGPLESPPEPDLPAARSELDALLGMDLAGYLPNDLLAKVDRSTMAASLEARAPFLDHRLVTLACGLPAEFKLRGVTGKCVLRAAVADLVPPGIRRRGKRGLTVPLGAWICGPLRAFVGDVLTRLDPRVVRPDVVRALFAEHVARRRDNRRELWALVMLQLWVEARSVAST